MRKLQVIITGDTRGLEKAYGRAGRATDTFGSKLKGMAKGGAITAGIAGFAGLAFAIKSSVSAAQEAEAAESRLEQALTSAGLSSDEYGEKIDAAIQKTSKLAGIDDEALSDTFAKLVRTTGDVEKAMDGMKLAADIARSRNVSLETATKSVEKAYLGSGAALKKFGVEGKTGLDAVEQAQKKFAGGAEAYGKTAAGAQEKFKVALENVQEQLGAKLLPVITKVMEALTRGLEWLDANGEAIGQVFAGAGAVIEKVFAKIAPFLELFAENMKRWVAIFAAIIDGDWAKVWDNLKAIVGNALKAAVMLLKLEWSVFKAAMKALGAAALEGLTAGLAALAGLVKSAIAAGLQAVRDKFFDAVLAATTLGGKILTGVGAGLAGIAGAVAEKIRLAIQAVRDAFETAYKVAVAFGGRIFAGLEKSLKGLGEAVAGWIRAPINAIIDAINNFKIPGLGAITIAGVTVFPGTPQIDPIPTIPRLAAGGVVTKPTLAVVGESGPEAVIPLHRGGNGGGGITIHVHGSVLTEGELTETVRRGLANVARRNPGALPGVA